MVTLSHLWIPLSCRLPLLPPPLASSLRCQPRGTGVKHNVNTAACPAANYTACNGGLPSNFCCAIDSVCLVTSGSLSSQSTSDANTTAICCPRGETCTYIAPIACNLQNLNATVVPTSDILSTELDTPLQSCTSGQCCPPGYTCETGLCRLSAQRAAFGMASLAVFVTQSVTTAATSTTSVSATMLDATHATLAAGIDPSRPMSMFSSSSTTSVQNVDSPPEDDRGSANRTSREMLGVGIALACLFFTALIGIAVWLQRRRFVRMWEQLMISFRARQLAASRPPDEGSRRWPWDGLSLSLSLWPWRRSHRVPVPSRAAGARCRMSFYRIKSLPPLPQDIAAPTPVMIYYEMEHSTPASPRTVITPHNSLPPHSRPLTHHSYATPVGSVPCCEPSGCCALDGRQPPLSGWTATAASPLSEHTPESVAMLPSSVESPVELPASPVGALRSAPHMAALGAVLASPSAAGTAAPRYGGGDAVRTYGADNDQVDDYHVQDHHGDNTKDSNNNSCGGGSSSSSSSSNAVLPNQHRLAWSCTPSPTSPQISEARLYRLAPILFHGTGGGSRNATTVKCMRPATTSTVRTAGAGAAATVPPPASEPLLTLPPLQMPRPRRQPLPDPQMLWYLSPDPSPSLARHHPDPRLMPARPATSHSSRTLSPLPRPRVSPITRTASGYFRPQALTRTTPNILPIPPMPPMPRIPPISPDQAADLAKFI